MTFRDELPLWEVFDIYTGNVEAKYIDELDAEYHVVCLNKGRQFDLSKLALLVGLSTWENPPEDPARFDYALEGSWV